MVSTEVSYNWKRGRCFVFLHSFDSLDLDIETLGHSIMHILWMLIKLFVELLVVHLKNVHIFSLYIIFHHTLFKTTFYFLFFFFFTNNREKNILR